MFSLKRKEEIIVKFMDHKLEEALFDGIRKDIQRGHFVLLNVFFSQLLPRLTSVYFFIFLK